MLFFCNNVLCVGNSRMGCARSIAGVDCFNRHHFEFNGDGILLSRQLRCCKSHISLYSCTFRLKFRRLAISMYRLRLQQIPQLQTLVILTLFSAPSHVSRLMSSLVRGRRVFFRIWNRVSTNPWGVSSFPIPSSPLPFPFSSFPPSPLEVGPLKSS